MQTPELLQDIEIPDAVTVLGQSVDLAALKAALQPLTSTLRSAVAQVGGWPAAPTSTIYGHCRYCLVLGLGAWFQHCNTVCAGPGLELVWPQIGAFVSRVKSGAYEGLQSGNHAV